MDQLPPLASGASKAATTATPFFLALDHTVSMSTSPPEVAPAPAPPSPASDPSRHSNHQRGSETIKAKIMSHPLYPALLRAFIDCRKVGAPPEVAGRLSSLAGDLESNSDDMQEQLIDPELDQFMETYCHMLVMYSQELTRQIQEADGFFRSMEAHADSLALDDKRGGSSSEDEPETGDDVAVLPAISSTSPTGEDKELKSQLLDKYSGRGYLSSLWMEISRKKTRGKLPGDARLKLLHWWQLHYRWPYPSELEKAELSESTGLDAKQINNWFINQRKRHWKPPTPVPAAGDHYRLQHGADGASSSSSAALCAVDVEGHRFIGSGSGYLRGGP